jgi:hypothetical protein
MVWEIDSGSDFFLIASTRARLHLGMMNTKSRSWGLVAVLLAVPACDADEVAMVEDTARGALMFDLTDDDVVELHDRYLRGEDIELLRAQLTAPFDCTRFGDFCEQVGEAAALEITARQVELALEGVSDEELAAQLADWTRAAMAEREDRDDELTFRSNGGWFVRTKGDYRLRVRNGINTPVFGQREAWTESQLQHQDALGVWWQIDGTEICANTGVNTQTVSICGGGVPCSETLLESFDPVKQCVASSGNFTQTTYHARNNGVAVGGMSSTYIIEANGCGSAEVNATTLGICADVHVAIF